MNATATKVKTTHGVMGHRITSQPIEKHHIRWTFRTKSQVQKLSKEIVAEIFPVVTDEFLTIEIRRCRNGSYLVLKIQLDAKDASKGEYAAGRDTYADLPSALYAVAIEYDPTRPHALV